LPPTLSELPKTIASLLRHPINRGHKLQALRRYFAWQVGSRFAAGPVAVELVPGARLLVRPDSEAATGPAFFGLQQFEDMAFVLQLLLPGDLFVDCGASTGSYTVLAGAAAGAHCLSFEPIEAAAKELATNVALNGLNDKVQVRRAGVAERAGRLRMTSRLEEQNHMTRDHEPAAEGSLWVNVETLDSHLENETRPFAVKIDVEGFELAVVRGGSKALALPNALALVVRLSEEADGYGFTPREFDEAVCALGFEAVDYDPFKRKLSDRRGGLRARGGHILYVKNRPVVAGRLAAAPLRRVLGTLL
jgi:FkbM family methyltransferase